MKINKEFGDLLPHISLDRVVFGFHENQLKVLLLHMNERFPAVLFYEINYPAASRRGKLDEVKSDVAHKAPALYIFNITNYKKALEEGFSGRW